MKGVWEMSPALSALYTCWPYFLSPLTHCGTHTVFCLQWNSAEAVGNEPVSSLALNVSQHSMIFFLSKENVGRHLWIEWQQHWQEMQPVLRNPTLATGENQVRHCSLLVLCVWFCWYTSTRGNYNCWLCLVRKCIACANLLQCFC